MTAAEKYVAAAYGLFLIVVLVWVAIIAAKLTRLERDAGGATREASGSTDD